MPYFPVDDDMPFHPKVLAAGNEAIGMWTRAGALCKKHATGGFVSDDTVRVLGGVKLARRLLEAGLWVGVDGGFRFHDWKQQAGNDDADVEKERAEKARERNAARQAAYRARNGESNGVTNGASNPPVTDTPSPSPKDLTLTTEISPVVDAPESTDELSPTQDVIAAQNGIDVPKVKAAISAVVGRDVSPLGALQVALNICQKAKGGHPDKPMPYVMKTLRDSAAEVQKYIDTEVA